MYFPKQFQTKEFVNTAIKRDVFDIRYASSEFLNDELLFWAIKTNNKIVKYIPKDVFSISIYKYLIENKIIIPDNSIRSKKRVKILKRRILRLN